MINGPFSKSASLYFYISVLFYVLLWRSSVWVSPCKVCVWCYKSAKISFCHKRHIILHFSWALKPKYSRIFMDNINKSYHNFELSQYKTFFFCIVEQKKLIGPILFLILPLGPSPYEGRYWNVDWDAPSGTSNIISGLWLFYESRRTVFLLEIQHCTLVM